MMKSQSIQSLLDWLEAKGLLQSRNSAEAILLCNENVPTVPMYIHLLMFFGAFMGCCFVGSLLFAMKILSSEDYSYVITGLVFIVIALCVYYPFRYSKPLLHSFSTQCALIFMFIGKCLFVWGAYTKFPVEWGTAKELWTITLAIGVITLLTYFIFPNVIDRFLSVLAFLTSLTVNFGIEYKHNVPIYIIFTALLIIIYALTIWRNRPKQWDPLVMACIIFMCLLTLFFSSTILTYLSQYETFWKVPLIAFNLTLAGFLIALCFDFAGSLEEFVQPKVLLACIFLFILSLISSNGILWSIGLLMLGYGKHQRALITFGAVFLILFLIEFYYGLAMTLEYKSFLLMASGVLLLFARSVMRYLRWDQD